jgi:hypothetical protein
MKLSCNAGISIGDFTIGKRPFVYEREKISQFFTGLGKNITFDIAFVAPRTVPYQPVLITSPLWSLSSGTNPLPPHVGHLYSSSVPFSITPSPLHGHVFCAMWTPPQA